MKRIGLLLITAGVLAVLLGSILIPSPTVASIFRSSRPSYGSTAELENYTYVTVDSSFVNDPNNNKTLPYADFNAPTGYFFRQIDVCNAQANAAQTVGIRFWASATDSTSLGGVHTIYLASGGAEVHSFPIRCHKATLTLIADTDDVYVIGYVTQ